MGAMSLIVLNQINSIQCFVMGKQRMMYQHPNQTTKQKKTKIESCFGYTKKTGTN